MERQKTVCPAPMKIAGNCTRWRYSGFTGAHCFQMLIYSALTERLWQYHSKWKQPKLKFSIFCGLPGTTSYLYLPLRTIDPLDTLSHPQGGVQIYYTKKENKSTLPQIAIFLKLTLYNTKLRIVRNFLKTRENIKISSHPFYYINLG